MIVSDRNVLTNVSALPPILMLGLPIPFCDYVTSLGLLVMDRPMDWCRHVSGVSGKNLWLVS